MARIKHLLPLAAALATLAGAANAAPFSYDCDTGAGRYSELRQVQSGPAYRISGRIAARELTSNERWVPVANVTIASADARNFAMLRLSAPTRKSPLNVVLSITKAGRTEDQTLGQVGLGEELPFTLTFDKGRVRAEIGTMRGEAAIEVGRGAKVAVSCSTSDFDFNDLRFSGTDR